MRRCLQTRPSGTVPVQRRGGRFGQPFSLGLLAQPQWNSLQTGQRLTQTAPPGGLFGRAQPPGPSATPPLTGRPVLQGRLVSTITREELESCFHMPSEQACRHLG